MYLCNYKERIENKKVAALIAGRKMEGTYTAAACTCREIIMKRKELWKNSVKSSAEKVVSLILGITCRRLLCLTRFFTVYTYVRMCGKVKVPQINHELYTFHCA